MNAHSGVAVLPRHPRAAADARNVLGRIAPVGNDEVDMAALLLSEVVSNAVRHAGGPAIEVAVGYDQGAGVVTGAVFDTNPRMGSGARSSRDEADADETETEMETGRGLDLLDAVAGAWGVATVGDRGKWVWFQVHAA
ncbi:ATP-binding protein [Streptomyces sp. NPDC048424]|uniref:ATP-binding protein n=1 Tax=Streptomyces sp. NPDC048424 TaxID=3155265 RepID=UPI00343F90BB